MKIYHYILLFLAWHTTTQECLCSASEICPNLSDISVKKYSFVDSFDDLCVLLRRESCVLRKYWLKKLKSNFNFWFYLSQGGSETYEAIMIERVLFIKPETCPLSVRPELYKQKEVTTGYVQWIHGHVLRILQFLTWIDLLQCYIFGPERVKKAYHHLQLWSKVE